MNYRLVPLHIMAFTLTGCWSLIFILFALTTSHWAQGAFFSVHALILLNISRHTNFLKDPFKHNWSDLILVGNGFWFGPLVWYFFFRKSEHKQPTEFISAGKERILVIGLLLLGLIPPLLVLLHNR